MKKQGWITTVSGMILAVILCGLALILTGEEAGAEWETNVFEEVIEIERTPDHVNDRSPLNNEPMHLLIETTNNQTINAADVSYTWSFEGMTSAKGGFQFKRIDQTTMEAEIPGYPGGYTINYEIIAYDEKNHPLTSATYSYTVVQNGSWNGDDFDLNLNMEWGPEDPVNGQPVVVNITSRDPEVAIKRADIFYTVNLPGSDPQDGVNFFQRVNNTHMTYEILPYPEGSTVSFHVEAYDSYNHVVKSRSQTYSYPMPTPGEPRYTGFIILTLIDQAEQTPADGATVLFYNGTYSYETETVGGIALTNQTVYNGTYGIKVTYKGEEYDFEVGVPRSDWTFSFRYEINKETFSVEFEDEERPRYLELIGAGIVLVSAVAGGFGAVKAKGIRERINERKKKARKRSERDQEFNRLESLFMDENKKELVLRTAAFGILSLLGLFFAPFYPWWMVLILAAFVTALSWKLPYISMIVLAVLVTASVAYQSDEFGWVFLIFSLVVMIGGFFDWKYAYFSFLTVFLAGFGFGFAIPLIAAVTVSLFMGTLVLITAGIFLLVIAPSGNFVWFSFLASPENDRSFVTFSRGVDSGWSPIDFVNEIADLGTVKTNVISTVLLDTMGSVIPFFGLLGWGAAMVLGYLILKKWEKGDVQIGSDMKKWIGRAVPGIIVAVFGVISILWADAEFTLWTGIAIAGCIPGSILAFNLRAFGEESLPLHYGVEEIRSSDVGKKVSDMVGFRKTSFRDIGGLEEVKREVKNALMVPLLEPEMATKYGVKPSKGMLLFGPPGCGKTLMLRAVASDLNVEMIGVKCSDVMSKWYGESEGLIASLFEEARAKSPCILFLDEIDAIAKRRDFYSTDDVTPRVLSIMLSEMDGMDDAEGIIVVATTNMPDLVDPALMRPGRFDKVIYVPPPDEISRREILKIHMKGKFVSEDIDIDRISKQTDGFSGADLANLVREASSLGLERALETRKPQPITMDDVEEILDEIKPSVTPKIIKMYDKLRREYERKKKGRNNNSSKRSGKAKENNPPSKGSSPPPPPPKPGSGKKGDRVYDLEDIEHEIDELSDWEGS